MVYTVAYLMNPLNSMYWYRWCLCSGRWREALQAGVAPPIYLEGCHENLLQVVSMDVLKDYALVDAREGGTEGQAK